MLYPLAATMIKGSREWKSSPGLVKLARLMPPFPVYRTRSSVVWHHELPEPLDKMEFKGWKVSKSYQTETVKALVKGIFWEAAYDRYPILADALEEASWPCQPGLDWLRSQEKEGNRAQWPLQRIIAFTLQEWWESETFITQRDELLAHGNFEPWGSDVSYPNRPRNNRAMPRS